MLTLRAGLRRLSPPLNDWPMSAQRIQLKRSKGWRIPSNTVKVDRSTKWGNPFRIGAEHPHHPQPITRPESVRLFREALMDPGGELAAFLDPGCSVETIRRELKGKNLACWCRLDQTCHADVLLEIANAENAH